MPDSWFKSNSPEDILNLALGVLLQVIERFLEFFYKFSEILLVDEDRLTNEFPSTTFGTLALYQIEKEISIDILFHIKKIRSIFGDQLCRKNFSTNSHTTPHLYPLHSGCGLSDMKKPGNARLLATKRPTGIEPASSAWKRESTPDPQNTI